MAKVLKTATFELRAAEVREPVERALHAYAAFVRAAVPGCAWTVFRDKDRSRARAGRRLGSEPGVSRARVES